MAALPEVLSPREVNLADILLDPNNPRFADFEQELAVPESRFGESKVQQQAYDRMKADRFDVAELRDAIKNLGFLPMDRIVVREWRDSDAAEQKYVVVEGNRRVAALRWLIELHEAAKETFTEKQLKNLTELEVLVLDEQEAPDSARWTLPGLRHVSGIKEWGPYQKGRAVFVLREGEKSPQEAAQSLGLSTMAANRLWRSYLALEQMRADEEFGDHAVPNLYSYFEEVFKQPNVRDWLSWSDEKQQFTNPSAVREFYGWMVGEPTDGGGLSEEKLPEAKSVRRLGKVIGNPIAMASFRAQEGSLTKAEALLEAERPQDWVPSVAETQRILASLSPDILRGLNEEHLNALRDLKQRIEQVLEDRERLVGEQNG